MGRIGHKERRFLAEILYGFITKDYLRIAEVHFEAGYVPATPGRGRLRAGAPGYRRADRCVPAAEISMARLLHPSCSR